ncbi:unnamed protein product, partial [Medioppia subpectinata]
IYVLLEASIALKMLETSILENILKELRNSKLPDKSIVLQILDDIAYVLSMECTMIDIFGPTNVIGDIHGQFYDLVSILDGLDSGYNMVFLGDYVDRGYNSIELIALHTRNDHGTNSKDGRDFILLRGNHESRAQTEVYGFKIEVLIKYDLYVYLKICDIFNLLPIAVRVNNKYFCIHGGIIPELTVEELNNTNRMQEYSGITDALWSDPSENIEYFSKSTRGAGFLFGKKALCDFLDVSGCEYLIRSHQLKKHFCKKCNSHMASKVAIYKKGKDNPQRQGNRRYAIKQAGFGGQTKPILRRKAKNTKKPVLKLKCSKCNGMTLKVLKRAKQTIISNEKKVKGAALTY